MIIKEENCLWCKKKFDSRTWRARKGVLKGMTITTMYCSKKCSSLMKTYLRLISDIEDLEEYKKKMIKKRSKK